jgi:hypothetical protein
MLVHRTKGKNVVKTYRLIPYRELAKVLKEDGEALLEDDPKTPFHYQTIWKAARRLSKTVGKKVQAQRALLRDQNGQVLVEGYSFEVAE